MNEKILIVEDERDIVRLLDYNLKKDGYRTAQTQNGRAALDLAVKEKPDLIILDLMLPGMDGLEVCKLLKKDARTAHIPIIMLTAKSAESDKIVGLELGADDYVTKPFGVKELLARIKAVLRRFRPEAPSAAGPEKLKCGALEADLAKIEVRVKGVRVETTAKEFELLRALLLSGGRVLSREVLLEKAWGVDAALEVETRTVDVHIGTLRKKLKGEGRRILTVKNYGYRFDDKQ